MDLTNLKIKRTAAAVMLLGAVLMLAGLIIQTPSKTLSTYYYSSQESGDSYIEEYVNGAAYNYIIGASLVGGEIAGAKTQKAVFICGGAIVFSMGLLGYVFQQEKEREKEKELTSSSLQPDHRQTISIQPSAENRASLNEAREENVPPVPAAEDSALHQSEKERPDAPDPDLL